MKKSSTQKPRRNKVNPTDTSQLKLDTSQSAPAVKLSVHEEAKEQFDADFEFLPFDPENTQKFSCSFEGDQFLQNEDLLEYMKELRQELLQTQNSKLTQIHIGYLQLLHHDLFETLPLQLTHILELHLPSTLTTERDCLKLAQNPQLTNLQSLDLSSNNIGVQGLFNLFSTGATSNAQARQKSHLNMVETLTLYSCEIKLSALKPKKQELIPLTQLRTINLSHNNLTGVKTISKLISQEKIEALIFVNCRMKSEDVEQLLGHLASCKQNLSELDLSQNDGVQFYNLTQICCQMQFHSLQTLSLSACPQLWVTKPLMTQETDSVNLGLPSLKRLELQDNPQFLKEDIVNLVQSAAIESVEYLDLSQCQIDNECLQQFFEHMDLPKLEFLILKHNEVKNLPVKLENKKLHEVTRNLRFIDIRFSKNLVQMGVSAFNNCVILAYRGEANTRKNYNKDAGKPALVKLWQISKKGQSESYFSGRSALYLNLPTEEQKQLDLI